MVAVLDKIGGFMGGRGGESAPRVDADGGGNAVGPADSSRAEAEARIEQIKRGRGRPRKDAELPGTGAESIESKGDRAEKARLAKELEKLFDPKYWRAVVRAPADARLAITGREHWKLSDDEVDSLADTASVAARQLVSIDPRLLATTLLLFNIATVYGSRLVLDSKLAREAAKK